MTAKIATSVVGSVEAAIFHQIQGERGFAVAIAVQIADVRVIFTLVTAKVGGENSFMQRQTYTLDDAVDLFLLDCASRRLTRATQKDYRAKLAVFGKWCKAAQIEYLDSLETNHIRLFGAHIAERGLTAQYQHNLLRAIHTFLNYAVKDGLIEVSPFTDRVRMPKIPFEVKPALTHDDIKRILANCGSLRNELIVTFFLDTGLRASELISLNVGNIDTKTGTVVLPVGKGQKGRTIFIGRRTRKLLIRYMAERGKPADNAPAFVSEQYHDRLTLSGIVQLMQRVSKNSGVKCTAHQLRRTFALEALRSGMSIYHLQKLMGHVDSKMLRRYLALTTDDIKDAHAKFGLIDNL